MVMVSLARFWNDHLELLAGSQRRQHVRRDRRVGVTAALLAGLDLQVDQLAVIDLHFCTGGKVEAERQLHQGDRRAGVGGDADVGRRR